MDAIADRLMFRLAYRKFADHESVVGNYTVSSGGVAGVRWFEIRNVTSGPVTVFQESTYQPDATWRWMGSAAMDQDGDLALGFSASSSSINPQIRYAGRLAGDPLNQLAQGEAHLFDGTGSQTGTGNRWGDYSDVTIDPVDDCTFWYTTEYYLTTSAFNWRTRIGNFKFASCGGSPTPTNTPIPPTATPTNAPTPTNTPIPPTATPTTMPNLTPTNTPAPTNTPVFTARSNSVLTGKGTDGSFVATDTFARKDLVVVHIHVADQNGANLSAATVAFSVRRPSGTTQCTLSAATDATGTAEGTCQPPPGLVGTWDAHVDNVTKAGYTYDAVHSVTDHSFTVQ